jgi:hypothetical protein
LRTGIGAALQNLAGTTGCNFQELFLGGAGCAARQEMQKDGLAVGVAGGEGLDGARDDPFLDRKSPHRVHRAVSV